MENPVKAVTSGVSLGNALKFIGTALVVFAVLDLLGLTNWILFPVTQIKAKIAAAKSTGS